MSVNAPGRDASPSRSTDGVRYSPSNGAGGVFAEFLQGATPKYAFNRGFRHDTQHRNTLARLFVRVDAAEHETFLNSIGDSQVRAQLADRIAGDPTSPRRRGDRISDSGYIDFLITQVQVGLQEKYQVSETLADNYVAYFFGQSAPVFTYSGYLINTVQDDQATNFFRLYVALLRGTQLARRQKIASLRYDSYIVAGSMLNLSLTHQGQNELLVPFTFQFLVKRVLISNYTAGWVPTRASGPFAADPLLVPYDGRPRQESSLQAIVARTPPGTVEGPVPTREGDGRLASTAPTNTTDPSALVSSASAPSASFSSAAVTSRPETVDPASVTSSAPNTRPRGTTSSVSR